MKKFLGAALLLSAITFAQPSPKLLHQEDFRYIGSFRLPAQVGSSTFDFGGTAMAYHSESLFAVGHPQQMQVAEVGIPVLSTGDPDSLKVARVIQPFTDITEGQLQFFNPGDPNGIHIGGLLPFQYRLYGTGFAYYDAGGTQKLSHFTSGLDFKVRGDFRGPVRVTAPMTGMVSGYLALVPPQWQRLLGGAMVSGQCCINIIGRTSWGPALFSLNPLAVGVSIPVPTTPLLYYPGNHPLDHWGIQSKLFNGSTQVKGVVIPTGSRSVLFFTRQGDGIFCYGEANSNLENVGNLGEPCFDLDDHDKGNHAWPYISQMLAYDVQDLIKVRSGVLKPWEPRPYAVWQLPHLYPAWNSPRGVAYDPATQRLFISQAGRIVNVFKISV